MRKTYKVAGILLMIPLYVATVYALPGLTAGGCDLAGEPSAQQEVGFCTQVSATVERGYYFDTITLPVYIFGIDFDILHKTFLPLLLLLAAAVWRR